VGRTHLFSNKSSTYCEFELKCVFSSFEYFQFEFNWISHTVFCMKVGLGFRVLVFLS
jgi:hypothetical protein